MIMGVVPGYAGQAFLPRIYRKISEARKMKPKIPITVDGGVTEKNAPRLLRAGAHYLVSTSAVYGKTTFTPKK